MTSRRNTLFFQGVNLFNSALVGIVLITFLFPEAHFRMNVLRYVLLLIGVELVVYIIYRVRHSRKEIDRELNDERNQMILERAVMLSHQTENWLLLGLVLVFCVFLQEIKIAVTLYWVLIGRGLLTFGIRWWMERHG